MTDQMWMEGAISIEATIRSNSRNVLTVYSQRGKRSRSIGKIVRMARAAEIPVREVDVSFIREQVSGRSHGGVIALVGERRYMQLDELAGLSENPVIVMVDGVEDPFNFGQSVRALYAAGATGMVVRQRNWLTAAGVVARASAGASELMPMAVVDDVARAAAFFRQRGFTVACAAQEGSTSIFQSNLTVPLFLLIGGERRGITRSFAQEADVYLRIPYQRQFRYALGAATSAAVIGFEIMRQRHDSAL